MSANGLEVFDKTIQTTHVWLNEIMQILGPDRHVAWRALSAVLQRLRDRLPVELAAHLGAELPLLVRGAYYDQYTPERQPADWTADDFYEAVAGRMGPGGRPVNARDAVRAVFRTLSAHVPAGQISRVQDALPQPLRDLWRAAEESVIPPPEKGEGGSYSAGGDDDLEERAETLEDLARGRGSPSDAVNPQAGA